MVRIFKYLFAMLIYWLAATNLTIAGPHPLAPPDTSSPRATLKSYLDVMGEYGRLMRTDLHTKSRTSEIRDQQLEDKAERCFDLSQVPRERVDDVANNVLNKLIEVLVAHPKVSSKDLRVRFGRFGSYSLDIDVFAYVGTTNRYEYWAIREDLNLRIMDIVKAAGTGFAIPSQTAYFTRDSGLDEEKRREAETQVKDWREESKLPFPEFDEKDRSAIENRLDYPPTGSPHHKINKTE